MLGMELKLSFVGLINHIKSGKYSVAPFLDRNFIAEIARCVPFRFLYLHFNISEMASQNYHFFFVVVVGIPHLYSKVVMPSQYIRVRPVASNFWLVRPGSGCGLWLLN